MEQDKSGDGEDAEHEGRTLAKLSLFVEAKEQRWANNPHRSKLNTPL